MKPMTRCWTSPIQKTFRAVVGRVSDRPRVVLTHAAGRFFYGHGGAFNLRRPGRFHCAFQSARRAALPNASVPAGRRVAVSGGMVDTVGRAHPTKQTKKDKKP